MAQSTHNASGSTAVDAETTDLVIKARDGNRFAFEQLVDRYQGDIFRMIYYRTRSRMDAEDLTQDVFVRALRNISRIREANRFRGWLYKIALNRVHDFRRKKKFRDLFKASDDDLDYQQPETPDHKPPEALDQVLKEDFWRQIGLLLEKLSSMEKEVFTLRFLDQLDIKEISTVLKKSESTIKTHLYRALAKFKKEDRLRQFLQEETP